MPAATRRDVIAALADARPVGRDRQAPCAALPDNAPHDLSSANPIATTPGAREAALAIWQASQAGAGNAGRDLSRARAASHLPPPPTLRFHAGLKHPSGGVWPAMVALVTHGADGTPLAIHRTFLARDGGGKAPVDPQKMMLGPCRGGAVRLGEPGDVLMVGEGIETCLAAMQATGNPAWAALSTSGLRSLDLPRDVARRDRARRWRRPRRGGGAGLRLAMEAGRAARAHRPPAAAAWISTIMLMGRAPRIRRRARNERRRHA